MADGSMDKVKKLGWLLLVGIWFGGVGYLLFGKPGAAAALLTLLPSIKRRIDASRSEGAREQAQAQSDQANASKSTLMSELGRIDAITERDIAEMTARHRASTGSEPTAEEVERWRKRFRGR